jgi:hypothetical protein
MITRFARRFAILAALLGLLAGIGGVAAVAPAVAASAPDAVTVAPAGNLGALSIPDSDISQNTVHSTAYRVGNGDTLAFYGALQAKGCGSCFDPVCYRMERLTANGDWVWSGFRWADTNTVVAPPFHCSNSASPYHTWKIEDGLTVRGVRTFRYDSGGANVATHCNTATSCRNMYQGT